MSKQYELTKRTKRVNGHILHRIRALRSITGGVEAGVIGGWVESEDNLSHEGNCWVDVQANVFGDAYVSENALVYDDAQVYDKAQIFGNATVCEMAQVYGKAQIFGNANVDDKAHVHGNATVCGYVMLYGKSMVYGNAMLCGHAPSIWKILYMWRYISNRQWPQQ